MLKTTGTILTVHSLSPYEEQTLGPASDYSITKTMLSRTIRSVGPDKFISGSEFCDRGIQSEEWLLTFDDGYRDFANKALRVLEHYGVPCIVFVCPGFVEERVLPLSRSLGLIKSKIEGTDASPVGTETFEQYRWKKRLKDKKRHERRRLITVLAEKIGADLSTVWDIYMNWEEIAELAVHPLVEVCSHTDSHLSLPSLSKVAAYRELKDSKDNLDDRLESVLPIVSYPYGETTLGVGCLAGLAGYRYGFSTDRPFYRNWTLARSRTDIVSLVRGS